MGKVILDTETRAKLQGLTQQIELYDEQGNLLGYCLPADAYRDSVRHSGPNPFSEEEIRTAFDPNDPGRPLADILSDLRKL
jgi:hypothetical protein